MFSTPCSFRNQRSARSGAIAAETQDVLGPFQKPRLEQTSWYGQQFANAAIGLGDPGKSVRPTLIPGHPQNLAYIYIRKRGRSVRSGQQGDRPLSVFHGQA